jgi:hypothetical protein
MRALSMRGRCEVLIHSLPCGDSAEVCAKEMAVAQTIARKSKVAQNRRADIVLELGAVFL